MKALRKISKYRIIAQAAQFMPDVFTYMDDIASVISPMISPNTYRELFKEHHARIIQAIKDNGMIAKQHICEKRDLLVDDFVEIGIQSFFPAQPSNNFRAIQQKYPEFVIHGGADSQSPIFSTDITYEKGAAEAKRCIDQYAGNGRYMVYISCPGTPNAAHQGFFEEA